MHDPAYTDPLTPAAARRESAAQDAQQAAASRIVRYSGNERSLHWALALFFFLAGLSGMALFHPSLFGLTGLFGGGPWTRVLHPYFGLLMVLAFFGFALVARLFGDNRITANDRQWLRRMPDVIVNREDRLPPVGRYNAGQKLLFFALIAVLLVLLVTGVLFWRPWFAQYFPIAVVRFAALAHAAAAALLMILMVVHIYSAFWVKGSIHAMVHGWVTERWARRHHPDWLRQIRNRSPR